MRLGWQPQQMRAAGACAAGAAVAASASAAHAAACAASEDATAAAVNGISRRGSCAPQARAPRAPATADTSGASVQLSLLAARRRMRARCARKQRGHARDHAMCGAVVRRQHLCRRVARTDGKRLARAPASRWLPRAATDAGAVENRQHRPRGARRPPCATQLSEAARAAGWFQSACVQRCGRAGAQRARRGDAAVPAARRAPTVRGCCVHQRFRCRTPHASADATAVHGMTPTGRPRCALTSS
jgi:hypothetical protein